jgi:hypothetical protein
LARLSSDGVLFITRPEAQLPRLLTTISAALGGDPSQHLMSWTERSEEQSFYSAVIVGRSSLSADDRSRIESRIRERPRLRPTDSDPLIAAILTRRPLHELEQMAGHRLDPAVDDRPFFHQRRRFAELGFAEIRSAFSTQDRARMALEDQPFAELSALLVLLETTVIGGLVLLMPIFFARDTTISRRRIGFTLSYFAALGLGFMLIEIALIQRLSLMLGRPAVAFATVFAGLLIGAGIGSRLSERFPKKSEATTLAAFTAAALVLLLEVVLPLCLALPEIARIAIASLLVLPVGVVLGMPFPLGLLETQRAPGRLIAWAFAANGVASIAGTVLALILATEIGFSGVLFVAAALYALARATFSRLGQDA